MTLLTMIRARSRPDALALVSARGAWTYRELCDGAERLARELDGAAPREVPLVAAVEDIAATALATLAGDLTGRIVVHADPAAPEAPAGLRLSDVDAPGPAGRGRGRPVDLKPGAGLVLDRAGDAVATTGVPPGAQIFLTSGSTGVPTGVVRDSAAILADAWRVADRLAYAPGAAVLAAAPVFHVYGFNYALIAPLLRGAAVHYAGTRALPSQLARAAGRAGAEVMIAPPPQYRLIVAPGGRTADFGPLRRAVSAGAPLPAGVAREVLARHRFTLWNCYGSSETGAVTLGPVTGEEPPGDAGEPLPGVAVQVEPVDGIERGGQLVIRTDSLASGRLSTTGLAAIARADGGYATGDLAHLRHGRIHLSGRLATVINVAGEKVAPAEIERVLAEHPDVRDVQVVAIPDATRGEVPAARVVAGAALSAAQLLGWCRERLPPHKLPRRIEFVADLPRSAMGKPVRGAPGVEAR